MPRKTRIAGRLRSRSTSCRPWTRRGTLASCCRVAARRGPANDGIGEPGFTHAGHLRCAIWNATPLFFAPSARQLRRPEVVAAVPVVGVAVQAAGDREELRARDRLRVVREALLCAHVGTCARSSEPSASFAVAPLYVRTPIEMTTSIAAISATGRREQPPLGANVEERHASSSTRQNGRDARSCRGAPSPAT